MFSLLKILIIAIVITCYDNIIMFTSGDNGLEYKGKTYDCQGDSTTPLVYIEARDTGKPLDFEKTYTAAEFQQHFDKYPRIHVNNKNAEYFYAITLKLKGKGKAEWNYATINIPGWSLAMNLRKGVPIYPARGMRDWKIKYPAKGETFCYELAVIKQKRQAILPKNGQIDDMDFEWHSNVDMFLCDSLYRAWPFCIKG